jgi:hypothetical protein
MPLVARLQISMQTWLIKDNHTSMTEFPLLSETWSNLTFLRATHILHVYSECTVKQKLHTHNFEPIYKPPQRNVDSTRTVQKPHVTLSISFWYSVASTACVTSHDNCAQARAYAVQYHDGGQQGVRRHNDPQPHTSGRVVAVRYMCFIAPRELFCDLRIHLADSISIASTS